MAPRKRTTKQQKNDPRALKLEAFLRDFDSEMETRVKQLEEKTTQMLKDVENSYNLALLKIPRAVRQMNWLQVFSKSGRCEREEEAAVLNSVMAEDYASLLKSVKKTSKKKGGAKSGSEEETVPSSTRKGRTTKRPPASSKRVKAPAASGQNTSLRQRARVRRSNRRPLVTPARNPLESSVLMGATPLFTPRFDPRLPQSSTVRVPRHKERVYSISVNGSPIAAGDEDVVINIPSGNGESLQLLASQINRVDLSQLDQTAVRSIRLLQNQLSTLCGISE
uniref:Cell division cycle associated 8 n=1 Tax=Tetraodon nigroviridis TaxID=99883 RepID=H3C6F5_TETNG